MIYPGEGKKGQPKAGDYLLAAERVRAEAAASPQQSTTAFDLARADRWEGQARTKQLPSTRTEIGAGRELIDLENRWGALGVVDTVADPDYVTASASRERLELANAQYYGWAFRNRAALLPTRAQIEKALVLPINTIIPYYEGIWTQAINVGAPVLLGQADSALVTLFEDLAWQVSGPQLRQSKPSTPSATWQRVTARWRGKEAGKK